MDWEISFDEKENILFVKTRGIFDLQTEVSLLKECFELLDKHNCRQCLIDNRKIDSLYISFMEIYSIPEKIERMNRTSKIHAFHIAQIFLEKHVKDFYFLETVCHNRGYLFSTFLDIESALKWLNK
jgi:CTP:phosphocholine cytidylyltransferase-like protein